MTTTYFDRPQTAPNDNYAHPAGLDAPKHQGPITRSKEAMLARSQDAMSKILEDAKGKVCGSRHDDYGPPEINHARTAKFWTTYLGIQVTPRQVAMCNILQKISRDIHCHKEDNLTDIIGYCANVVACELPAT